MGQVTFTTSYNKNEGLVISPSELKDLYFYGVNIKSPDGTIISDQVYKTYILSAQEEMEKYLNIKLQKQIIEEDRDFHLEDYKKWGYIRTSFPVNEPLGANGFINTERQIEFPVEWLTAKRSSQKKYYRQIQIVPIQGGVSSSSSVVYNGITPHLSLYGSIHIPNYWKIKYCTGFEKMPNDLLNFIGKLAAINLFHIAGDLILGAGIASQSIGIDGLSQSISTTSSATNAGYGSRIGGYLDDLKTSLPRITSYYRGITMLSM